LSSAQNAEKILLQMQDFVHVVVIQLMKNQSHGFVQNAEARI
jgi:hypothetical protein